MKNKLAAFLTVAGIYQNPAYAPPSDTVVWEPSPQYVVGEQGGGAPKRAELALRPFVPLSITIPAKESNGEQPRPKVEPETLSGGVKTPTSPILIPNLQKTVPNCALEEHPDATMTLAGEGRATVPTVVYFALASADLSAGEMEKLNTLPLGKMYRITGSSSPDGPKGINKMLSEKRAQAVKEWLVARGIKELKTAVDGGGNVENGDSGMGMAKSRKVVIEEIQ